MTVTPDPFALSLPPSPLVRAAQPAFDSGAPGAPVALSRALAGLELYRGRIIALESALRPFAEPDELPSLDDWDRAREVLYAPIPEPKT